MNLLFSRFNQPSRSQSFHVFQVLFVRPRFQSLQFIFQIQIGIFLDYFGGVFRFRGDHRDGDVRFRIFIQVNRFACHSVIRKVFRVLILLFRLRLFEIRPFLFLERRRRFGCGDGVAFHFYAFLLWICLQLVQYRFRCRNVFVDFL